ncbi:cysteine-rich receptor-like protein kinase 10 [Triticum dicoccoides]|uniref:cysteine-rich receptor-like protein kinase 10 n=1 Tax=Triticum dicoccoides TaxID=85692 RepID=UPI0018911349|nr:cysteine-rich receptor-like protein kinase 10 [Triticum dicoccoides]
MATWNGVGQVASVAQLAGIDAYGLIKMIVEAVQTVRRNKETCQKLARRVKMIGDLLQELHEAQLMQHRDTRNPVDQLEETLRRAFMLITTCQDSSFMYHCFTGGNQACQLREVENDIAFYLQIFPLVSHVDTSRTLVLHLSRGQPSPTEEYAEEAQILKDDSGHATSPRIEATAETVESRLQGVNRNLPGSNIFYGSQKSKVKRLAVGKDILVKLFCAARRSRLLLFNLSQVEKYTENFKWDNVVGCGAFGYVYKGNLPSGIEIAVKRFATSSTQGSAEFSAEIETIANLQHRNVIRLLGFCIQREKDFLGFQIQQEEMILVYEYMPNKSLASFLYSYTKTGESLNWSKLLDIIEGIAQGLVYLHDLSSHQCVVHMDLKANNILLDYEMNPKISDFGMARILPSSGTEETLDTVKGTTGYMDPEYIRSGKFSAKSDVYSFGIMILEIVSRKKCLSLLSNGDMMDLPTRAWELWKAGKPHELADVSSPSNDQQTAQIIRCIHVALLCIQDCPMHRPTMLDVLLMLRSESFASLPTPSVPVNHTDEHQAEALTLEGFWEVNVPLQPVEEMVTS